MLIEQDLTRKDEAKVGMVGRLWPMVKRAGSQKWEKVWDKPIKNLVVNKGLARMAYLLMSNTPKKMKCGAIGTGSTAATDTDTALETQILTRDPATLTTDTTAVTGDTAKFVSSFTSDTTSYAVTEYGTFETETGGDMLNRVTFAAITLNLNDVLEFTYTVQIQKA